MATTNAVNLTDGLDGLASSTVMTYMFSFAMLMLVLMQTIFASHSQIFLVEMQNLLSLSLVTVGAMMSFLVFNCFPAKIFMGDTGSLALGGTLASIALLTNHEITFIIIIIFNDCN